MRNSNERGIAMITTLLVLMLISALLVGFTTVVMSDQRYRFIDRDRGQAFYAASGGIEKLTADLGNLFFTTIAPKGAEVLALTTTASKPVITGVTYTSSAAPDALPASNLTAVKCVAPKVITTLGSNGYTIKFCADATGAPTTITPSLPIATGAYEGLIALQSPYQLDVTARSSTGGEVHLVRSIESVAIPVFQFGMFSDVDLSFSAADDFGFGGRIHTNSNLFLSSASGSTLTLSDKITAVGEIIRQRLSNGVSIDSVGHTNGVVSISTGSSYRTLVRTEGSLTDGLGSSQNEPTWHTVSLSNYNSYIRNSRTGAKELKLPLISVGGSNPDLIKRPLPGENVTNSILYGERLFSRASLRILLSDNLTDITNLPTVTAAGAVQLNSDWNIVANAPPYVPTLATANPRPPIALSPGMIMATVSSSTGGTITFASTAAAAPFKPTFTLAGSPNVITCTGKATASPWRLTGCTGAPIIPTTIVGTLATAISPAGGSVGANAPIWLATNNLNNWIEFQTSALLNTFNPMPFWDATSGTLVTCTGWTTTTYTGCSSNPPAGAILMSAAMSNPGTSLLGGWIKIERQNTDNTWADVTSEILNYGIGGPNQTGGGTICADPTPRAIIRLQRLRDNAGAACNYNTDATGAKDPTNWWPNVLFDAREGLFRDTAYPGTTNGQADITLGGLMYYVNIDVGNLAAWFKGTATGFTTSTGPNAIKDNGGFTVYFSDRRNNRNTLSQETGEYEYEDFVNPGVANGVPNSNLDAGEDVNANSSTVTTPEVYGGVPNYNGVYNSLPPCTLPTPCAAVYNGLAAASETLFLTAATRPQSTTSRRVAQVNRPILFRRALKLSNGATISPTLLGLTVVSENPVYIHGDYNATGLSSWGASDVHAATAVIGDAVTVLSNNWADNDSFGSPYNVNVAARARTAHSWYRVAIISGKGPIFSKPSDVATGSTFGTDGGAHSFLRMLEGENGLSTTPYVHYRGSMATFFYNRQAVGPFKCCGSVVYSVPTRDFIFDIDFLDPAKLPPNTPVFRDMNAVGFSQELRPGK